MQKGMYNLYQRERKTVENLFASSLHHAMLIEGTAQGAQHIFTEEFLQHMGYVTGVDRFTLNGKEKAISVQDIRDLKKHLWRKPVQSAHTVGAIFSADTMTLQASNALLKALEEPPEHVKIILTVTDISRLPKTIVSRCAQIFLPALNQKNIAEIVHQIKEHPNPNSFALYESNLQFLESDTDPLIQLEQVISFLEGDVEQRNATAKAMIKAHEKDLKAAVQDFLWFHIYAFRLITLLSVSRSIDHTAIPYEERILKIAKKHSSWYNIHRIDVLQDLQKKLEQHVSPKRILDYLTISL